MMTLDEAIRHCEEVVVLYKNKAQRWHKQTKGRIVDFCDKAIQEENDCIECARDHEQLAGWLTELKQLREQTRWIPCSERLPERDESVLAYHRDVAFDYQYVSWIDDYSGKWAGFCGSLSDEVLAWMPLPEGYKEDKG